MKIPSNERLDPILGHFGVSYRVSDIVTTLKSFACKSDAEEERKNAEEEGKGFLISLFTMKVGARLEQAKSSVEDSIQRVESATKERKRREEELEAYRNAPPEQQNPESQRPGMPASVVWVIVFLIGVAIGMVAMGTSAMMNLLQGWGEPFTSNTVRALMQALMTVAIITFGLEFVLLFSGKGVTKKRVVLGVAIAGLVCAILSLGIWSSLYAPTNAVAPVYAAGSSDFTSSEPASDEESFFDFDDEELDEESSGQVYSQLLLFLQVLSESVVTACCIYLIISICLVYRLVAAANSPEAQDRVDLVEEAATAESEAIRERGDALTEVEALIEGQKAFVGSYMGKFSQIIDDRRRFLDAHNKDLKLFDPEDEDAA